MIFVELIKVAVKEAGTELEVREMGNDLETMQAFVGGNIEIVFGFVPGIATIFNKESEMDGLPPQLQPSIKGYRGRCGFCKDER